ARPVPGTVRRRALRHGVRQGQSTRLLREPCAREAEGQRHARGDPAAVASEGDRRAGPEVAERSSKVLGLGASGPRGAAIAFSSTVVFAVLVVVLITHAPGWPEVRKTFFDWGEFRSSFPEIARAFLLNVKIF